MTEVHVKAVFNVNKETRAAADSDHGKIPKDNYSHEQLAKIHDSLISADDSHTLQGCRRSTKLIF